MLKPEADNGKEVGGYPEESFDVNEPVGSTGGVIQRLRRRFSIVLRAVWRRLPVPPGMKNRVAGFVFRRMPILVGWSATYRNWKIEEERLAEARLRRAMRQPIDAGRPVYRDLSGLPRPASLLARAIAFYLPQFHPIPENDEWWGQGFTEWTNVRRAKPQFEGHDQPIRPGELGYYDLLQSPHVRRRQAALAKQYGLEAFCFYFYWFAGKRLLEAPIEAWAADEEIDFPFCLCWANENWSRTWDGREQEVLIGQKHSPEDDIAFISYLARYLRNPKYLRVKGRPLVMVYRPGLLPDAKATSKRWRTWCRENGIGEIYLVCTQSFDLSDPAKFGFDAAAEFPPNNMGMAPEEGFVHPVADDFQCKIYDWSELPARAGALPAPSYKLFRGVTPRWDNTARRMSRGTVFVNTDPDLYSAWLRDAALDVGARFSDPSERLVFINSWNEWAEGAHIEPDLTHGYTWLEATRNGLQSDTDADRVEPADLVHDMADNLPVSRRKIIVVVHDLHRHGAQYLSLSFVSVLHSVFGYDVATIACGEGVLAGRFATYGKLVDATPGEVSEDDLREAISGLVQDGYAKAIVNSSASGWIAPYLAEAGIFCIGLVHELPEIIAAMQLETGIRALDEHAGTVVFPSRMVEHRTAKEVLGHDWRNPLISPQGLYKRDGIAGLEEKEPARLRLCAELGLPDTVRFVVGVGYGDRRKGVDIFCRWAVAAARADADAHFIWVGGISEEMDTACQKILADNPEARNNLHFVGFRNDTGDFYAAASLFVLTSREDPFPTTVMEALDAGTPVFMISGTSGVEDLSESGAVTVLPDEAPDGFVNALSVLFKDPENLERVAKEGLDIARSRFGFRSFVGDMLRLLDEPVPRISVVVPNYNYAHHLPQRIASILSQSLPVWEIIFLDDKSSDDSVAVAKELLHNCSIRYRIIENEQNSGSVFAQWQKGVELAEGDIIWIAEADDWAGRDFLKTAALAFRDPEVVVSYTQSNQVSGEGEILAASYLDYVADVDPARWRKPFVTEGLSELANGLSVKNTLPNVSGVLFRRDALKGVLSAHMDEIRSYRVAGDWCVYARMAGEGKFAFDPRPMNYHRRHSESVTISKFGLAEWEEIQRMQEYVAGLCDVSDDMAGRAAAYLDHLAKRL
nr:glycoside hydrolase family 99-like domain-containing protein [uncultured Hyphomonas sp.]